MAASAALTTEARWLSGIPSAAEKNACVSVFVPRGARVATVSLAGIVLESSVVVDTVNDAKESRSVFTLCNRASASSNSTRWLQQMAFYPTDCRWLVHAVLQATSNVDSLAGKLCDPAYEHAIELN